MADKIQIEIVNRRDFVLGASAVAALTAMTTLGSGEAWAKKSWQDVMKELTNGASPAEGKVSLELPEIAENGRTVPFTITADSPMSAGDHVKAIHILATGNPVPLVASVYFTPDSGKATVTSRMRLGKTQDVVAVAEMSNGKTYMGKRQVKVTIGGCGG